MSYYNRQKAITYAHRWASARNPEYYNFDKIGGDCTNFVSQSIFAGCGKMNYEKMFGWYYVDLNERSPAWTGVGFLYKFLLNNKGSGPYGSEVSEDMAEVGDIVQLDFGMDYAHSSIIVFKSKEEIRVAAHSFDCDNKLLSDYNYDNARFIHIEGVRI